MLTPTLLCAQFSPGPCTTPPPPAWLTRSPGAGTRSPRSRCGWSMGTKAPRPCTKLSVPAPSPRARTRLRPATAAGPSPPTARAMGTWSEVAAWRGVAACWGVAARRGTASQRSRGPRASTAAGPRGWSRPRSFKQHPGTTGDAPHPLWDKPSGWPPRVPPSRRGQMLDPLGFASICELGRGDWFPLALLGGKEGAAPAPGVRRGLPKGYGVGQGGEEGTQKAPVWLVIDTAAWWFCSLFFFNFIFITK